MYLEHSVIRLLPCRRARRHSHPCPTARGSGAEHHPRLPRVWCPQISLLIIVITVIYLIEIDNCTTDKDLQDFIRNNGSLFDILTVSRTQGGRGSRARTRTPRRTRRSSIECRKSTPKRSKIPQPQSKALNANMPGFTIPPHPSPRRPTSALPDRFRSQGIFSASVVLLGAGALASMYVTYTRMEFLVVAIATGVLACMCAAFAAVIAGHNRFRLWARYDSPIALQRAKAAAAGDKAGGDGSETLQQRKTTHSRVL